MSSTAFTTGMDVRYNVALSVAPSSFLTVYVTGTVPVNAGSGTNVYVPFGLIVIVPTPVIVVEVPGVKVVVVVPMVTVPAVIVGFVPPQVSLSFTFPVIVPPCGAELASSLATMDGVGVEVTVTLMLLVAVPPFPSEIA